MARERRDWGSGSVYQDKHGQWWARVQIGPGRYRRARVDSEQAGRRTVKEWLAERDAGINLRIAHLSLRVWVSRWIADLKEVGRVRPRTIEFYERHAGYGLHYLGHLAIEDLEPEHWRATQPLLLRDGLSRRSVNHVQAVLHTALGRAVKDRAIAINPLGLVDRLPLGDDAFEARALVPQEINAFLDACEGERLGIMYRLILAYGLRHGEARALRWSDIQLDGGAPSFSIRESKSRAGRRTLPLTAAWVADLRAHWQTQAEERIVAGDAWREHGLTFPSEVGTMLGEGNSTRTFKRLLRKAGLDPSIRIHDLRHTAITDWIADGGADPKTAQGLAGHSSAATTMDLYAKSRQERARETIKRVERKRKKKG